MRVDLSCQIKDIDFKLALLMVIFDHPKQKLLIGRERRLELLFAWSCLHKADEMLFSFEKRSGL